MPFWTPNNPGGKRLVNNYQSVLGANLLEMWHSGLGVSTSSNLVTSWTGQVQGIVTQPTAAGYRPAYTADGTNFRGKNIIQFSSSSWTNLRATLSSPGLGTAGQYGHIMSIVRFPSTANITPNSYWLGNTLSLITRTVTNSSYPSTYMTLSLSVTSDGGGRGNLIMPNSLYYWISGTYPAQYGSMAVEANNNGPTIITSTCMHEAMPDTIGLNGAGAIYTAMNIDAINIGTSAASSTPAGERIGARPMGAFYDIQIGGQPEYSRGTDARVAMIMVCANPPSADQRRAILNLAKWEWGF